MLNELGWGDTHAADWLAPLDLLRGEFLNPNLNTCQKVVLVSLRAGSVNEDLWRGTCGRLDAQANDCKCTPRTKNPRVSSLFLDGVPDCHGSGRTERNAWKGRSEYRVEYPAASRMLASAAAMVQDVVVRATSFFEGIRQ